MEKQLLHLQAANDVDSFWNAVQDVIGAGRPELFHRLTLQHSRILPRIAKATQKPPRNFFPIGPIEKYFDAHPHRNILFLDDFFPTAHDLRRSSFTALYGADKWPICDRLILLGRQGLLAAIIVEQAAAGVFPLSVFESCTIRVLDTLTEPQIR